MAQLTRTQLWDFVLNWVYPPRCGGCDRRGEWFCPECSASIRPSKEQAHSILGVQALVCAGAFDGPLRQAIHHLKYESDRPLARPLSGLVYSALQNSPAWPDLLDVQPAIVPVPLHKARQRARGFNQSGLLAQQLAYLSGWTVNTGLQRPLNTRAQVGLDAEERRANVLEAFAWQGSQPPRSVLLIDDVFTTGATLAECVAALRTAGVRHIYVAAVARARGVGDDKL